MIFQTALPYDVFAPRPLPGVAPIGDDPWFIVDDAYAGQMAHREAFLATRADDVLATDAPSQAALGEMLSEVLAHLPSGFRIAEDTVLCPDGRSVPIDRAEPFRTLGRILQEDVCLLEKRGDEHVLTGAVLCFPASWRLSEKIGHPLTHIHMPVPDYDAQLARRVQRLFDGVRPGRAIWRFNALWYADPELHQPRSSDTPRELTDKTSAPYLRSERQVIWRLPKSGGVLFTIHTFVIPRAAVATAFAPADQLPAR
ncbi:heme-dependent oxidative N-demethylase family protein [Marivita hallyeonensis]|uniref:DUF3445 domain-containing protein n=1 Tax=Marivita hallyeonensis TaxID=996342 RepID=A0A1M5VT52_9RHOB|nr:DUF3445 domain-containing protein [Marivita hallyeonensis]SHH78174.1 Protein of unknown function [Marivita hallyeonensis]